MYNFTRHIIFSNFSQNNLRVTTINLLTTNNNNHNARVTCRVVIVDNLFGVILAWPDKLRCHLCTNEPLRACVIADGNSGSAKSEDSCVVLGLHWKMREVTYYISVSITHKFMKCLYLYSILPQLDIPLIFNIIPAHLIFEIPPRKIRHSHTNKTFGL